MSGSEFGLVLTDTQDLWRGVTVGLLDESDDESATPHLIYAADPAGDMTFTGRGGGCPQYSLLQIPSTSGFSIWQVFHVGLRKRATLNDARTDQSGRQTSMQAVLALRHATGIAAGLARGVVLFTLHRARTIKRTLFSSSTVSTQLALLAINFCFLYAGAPPSSHCLATGHSHSHAVLRLPGSTVVGSLSCIRSYSSRACA